MIAIEILYIKKNHHLISENYFQLSNFGNTSVVLFLTVYGVLNFYIEDEE